MTTQTSAAPSTRAAEGDEPGRQQDGTCGVGGRALVDPHQTCNIIDGQHVPHPDMKGYPEQITIAVWGNPAPQGSKRHVGNGVMVESSKAVKPWRQDVVAAAKQQMASCAAISWSDTGKGYEPFDGPLRVWMVFTFRRPKSHYRTGRNAHLLRDNAPVAPSTIPDLSKICRATEDALTTAGVWADDARVAEYARLAKVWCADYNATAHDKLALDSPGCLIVIEPIR